MKTANPLILALVLGLLPTQGQATGTSVAKHLKRLTELQKAKRYPHLRKVRELMTERFGFEKIQTHFMSDANAVAHAPTVNASANHSQNVAGNKKKALENFQAGKLTEAQYSEASAHKWLPLAEFDSRGKTKLVRFSSQEEFDAFQATVYGPGYKYDPKSGQVYFDDYMDFKNHPEVSVLDNTQGDAVAWQLIHERAKTGLGFDKEFVHDVSRIVNEQWALRNQHKLELANLELAAMKKSSLKRAREGLPERTGDAVAIAEAEAEVERRATQLKGLDYLDEGSAAWDIERVTALIEEYAKVAVAENQLDSIVEKLIRMGSVLDAKQTRALAKQVSSGDIDAHTAARKVRGL